MNASRLQFIGGIIGAIGALGAGAAYSREDSDWFRFCIGAALVGLLVFAVGRIRETKKA